MKDEESKFNLPPDKFNEPSVGYGALKKSRITFFKSFEEASEADYQFYRNLSPEQRMNIHFELSRRVFGNRPATLRGRFSF
ncbi:MAG: hypothetical protein JWO06_3958 [Bacteroidota bacterium]|nr:hypothetical protein [Bacteroidota bacterium]